MVLAVWLNAHEMKTIFALLLATSIANAAPRLEDYLTTRTVTYGAKAEIMVQVMRHESGEMLLIIDDKMQKEPKQRPVSAGNGLMTFKIRVNSGWSITLLANGRQVDKETATRKTGITSVR